MTEPKAPEKWIVLLLSLAFFISIAMHVSGTPQGADIISNQSEGTPSNPADSRADAGGTITILELDSTQQNTKWKAYVGNVSGRLTLDDSSGNTIYDWSLVASNIEGEVYVSRNSSVTWSNVSCANQTAIQNEESFLGMSSSAADSINNTFNYTTHRAMQIGGNSISKDSCRATATYINDTDQGAALGNSSLNATFEEILLQDVNLVFVYATFIDQDQFNYKNQTNETYDFQLIVGSAATPTTYYFYMEIESQG